MKKILLKKRTSQYLIHPEQKPEEVFIGNSNNEIFKGMRWKSKRKGNIAYELLTNKILKKKDLFPVFVNKEEMENHRQSKFIKGDNNE